MGTTYPTTEAAFQAGLLPAQERRKGHFTKVSGRLKVFRRPETFAKPDICRTRAGGCPVQSSALLVSHISENKKFSIKSKYLIVRVDGNYLSDN